MCCFLGSVSEGEVGKTEGSILSVQMSYHNELYQDMPQGKNYHPSFLLFNSRTPLILYGSGHYNAM